jgi:uncharacterized protein (DUF488 family)
MNRALRRPLFTIGHSNHPIEHFLALLSQHRIEAVADVRSRPYSRFVPHFGKERLARLLEAAGFRYLYLGRELGGTPPKAERPPSAISYQMRVEQPAFRQGIERLLDAARANRVALMCRERDPLDCHRFHLVCRYLRPLGLDIRHILPSAEVEAQQATERRLLDRAGTPELPLLQDLAEPGSEQALAQAYDSWWHSPRS